MSQRLDEFKEFVKRHPLIKEEVYSKRKTWQELYEEFVILGEESFKEEKSSSEKSKEDKKTDDKTSDVIKQIIGYVKKIDPDQVTKTVTSIQKVLELFGSFGAGASANYLAKKSTGDPLFDKRFDEWY